MAIDLFSKQMALLEGAKLSVRESEYGAGCGTMPSLG